MEPPPWEYDMDQQSERMKTDYVPGPWRVMNRNRGGIGLMTPGESL